MLSGRLFRLCTPALLAGPVFSSPLFTWDFSEPVSISSLGTLAVSATLSNAGSDPIGGPSGSINRISNTTAMLLPGSFRSAFTFLWNLNLFGLNDAPLPPGGQYRFLLGDFVADQGPEAQGTFTIDSAWLSINGSPPVAPGSLLSWSAGDAATVSPPVIPPEVAPAQGVPDSEENPAAVVPEPSSLMLLGAGFIAFGMAVRRKRS